MIAATDRVDNQKTIVYVVLDNGANSRVRALGRLSGPDVEFVYVSSRDINVAPLPNLVVAPLPNPFGVLRALGFHRAKHALDSMAYFPTRHRLYVMPVVQRLKRRVAADLARGKRVVVLTCAPPHALCVVGQKLKAKFPQIRWVIDWQDLWSHDEVYFNAVFSPYRARAKRLERDLVLQSDLNVTTNRFAKRAIEELHRVEPRRVMVINHHFDVGASGVRENSADRQSVLRRIVFMGGMFKPPKVPGGKFLEALKTVRARSAQMELHLYGRQGFEFEPYRKSADEYGLIYHGSVPRAQVADELVKYDYQLLLLEDLPNSKLIMHLKLPEYLKVGVPIVAIVPKGSAVEEIVQRTGTGYVIAADSDWADGLTALLDAGLQRSFARNAAEIARFDWANIEGSWREALELPGPHALTSVQATVA